MPPDINDLPFWRTIAEQDNMIDQEQNTETVDRQRA